MKGKVELTQGETLLLYVLPSDEMANILNLDIQNCPKPTKHYFSFLHVAHVICDDARPNNLVTKNIQNNL